MKEGNAAIVDFLMERGAVLQYNVEVSKVYVLNNLFCTLHLTLL